MALQLEDDYETSSTPKICLSKLPCKPRQPQEMLTPPLLTSVSVPFQWEEAPGKPRATASMVAQAITTTPPPAKYKSARCLDLPPRLLTMNSDTSKSTILPSPTTVLEGPYMERSVSNASSVSLRREPHVVGVGNGSFEGLISKKRKEKMKFGSWRWGSFKEDEKSARGSFDFSTSLRYGKSDKNVKITRISKSRKSFFNFSGKNDNSWGIFSSFKMAVPWRCKQER